VSDRAPFLTAALPGTGGVVKESDDDFEVDEIPARRASGRGDFAWARVEKRGISTNELVRRLASALRVPPAAVGVAGLKDADAIARQWISVPWSVEPQLSAATIKDVEILEIAHDDRPLALGDLAGNRFKIQVRGVDDEAAALPRARAILAELARRGVPHFFGKQRFGVRGESAEVGRRLLLGDAVGALDLVLGAPSERERDPRCRRMREAYERGDYRGALAECPGRLANEARLLDLLARGRDRRSVAGTLAPEARRFWLSAWQSLQFNRVLARRVERLDVALLGDLLMRDPASGSRATHACVDPAVDQPAVARLELHPTAPMFGEHVELADGEAGALEAEVLAATGIAAERLRRPTGLSLHGERRVIRFAAHDVDVAVKTGERTLVLQFRLPPGCYATTLVAEITKSFTAPI
jgi:tRNA pseudouridine13 synthase